MGHGGIGDDVVVGDPLPRIGQWVGHVLVLRRQLPDASQVSVAHSKGSVDQMILAVVPEA